MIMPLPIGPAARCLTQLVVGVAIAAPIACQAAEESDRPNFLLIIADDCTHSDLRIHGGRNAHTPNVDRLAAAGTVFERAYLSEAMCQPCRAELYTGQFPMRNGCAWNHSASRPETRSMPHHLRGLGYRVGLSGKVHVKPKQAFPFDRVAGFDGKCTRDPTRDHDTTPIRDYMRQDGPFCLVVALVEPHVPWVMGDASRYPPDSIELPPNIADTPATRDAFSRYLAEITYMDGQVGEILEALDDAGKSDDTLVLFTSEQGSQFPGCKWTNWDTGLHTAFVARWPGRVKAGRRTSAMVQYCDVLPTLMAAANAPGTAKLDGISFLPVLLGTADRHRDYVFGIHNNLPEGPAYPIRSVFDGEHRLIRNLLHEEIYIEKHLMGGKGALQRSYWATWMADSQQDERTYRLVHRYMRRPPVQLYDTAEDPYELDNRADDASLAEVRTRLSLELDRWMASQGDPGAPQDTKQALEAARRGQHRYGPSRR